MIALLIVCGLSAAPRFLPAAAGVSLPEHCSEQAEVDHAVELIDPHRRITWNWGELPDNGWGTANADRLDPVVDISSAVPCRSIAATMVHEGAHVLQARVFADPRAVFGKDGIEEIADVAPIVLGVSDGYSPYLCQAARRPVTCLSPPVPPKWIAAVNALLAYR